MTVLTEGTTQMVEVLREVAVIMLTTHSADGHLMSRPMSLKRIDPDGTVWLFADVSATIANDIRSHAAVSIAHVDATRKICIVISGKATLSDDRARISALWTEDQLPFFPLGAGDPGLVLIRVQPLVADRWDANIHRRVALPGGGPLFARESLVSDG
jgi:general stress protein 26